MTKGVRIIFSLLLALLASFAHANAVVIAARLMGFAGQAAPARILGSLPAGMAGTGVALSVDQLSLIATTPLGVGDKIGGIQAIDSAGNKTDIQVAAGGAGSAAAYPKPNAPATSSTTTNTVYYAEQFPGQPFGSFSAACAAAFSGAGMCSWNGGSPTYSSCSMTSTNGPCTAHCSCPEGQQWDASVTITSSPGATGCPGGYQLYNNTVCNLQDAEAALSDKALAVRLDGDTFSLNGADADYPSGGTITNNATGQVTPLIRDNGRYAYINGVDSAGRPTVVKVYVDAAGGKTYITQYSQENLTSGSQVQSATYTVNTADGTVTAINTSSQPGTVSPSGGSTTPVVDTGTGGVPSVTTSPSTTINFPTDYARVGEAQKAADSLKAPVEVADPVLPVEETDVLSESFSGLKGWTLPGHSSQCPTGSFQWNGTSYVFDAHCPLINNHWGIFQTAMGVVWSVLALFIVLRA